MSEDRLQESISQILFKYGVSHCNKQALDVVMNAIRAARTMPEPESR